MVDIANAVTELARVRSLHHPGSCAPHTVVVLPSYSVARSLLAHYADRLLDMEHRHLLTLLMLPRVPGARAIFVTSRRPAPAVLDYYVSLAPPDQRGSMRSRLQILEVPDASPRSVTAKLLDRPDLLDRIRQATRGRPAYIEPWNATSLEMEVAEQLGLPLNGTAPQLWPLGFKSNGRRLMRLAGVPVPLGHEDVRTVDEVLAAAVDIRGRHPGAAGVVVKVDDSAAGDGNRVLRFAGSTTTAAGLRAAVESLEPEFLAGLESGGVVEELLGGSGFTCPSVQVEISPWGNVEVLSTHEQVMTGRDAQVYQGCEFPAHPHYGARLATYGASVGHVLAERGVLGQFSVDFAAMRSSRGWSVEGLEINLRKSGTTHPLSLLHNLAPGGYDTRTAQWVTAEGTVRAYRSTDILVHPRLLGRSVGEVVQSVRAAGLDYDRWTRIGVVLHNFCGLDAHGRLGLTAIGLSPGHAREIYARAVDALTAPPPDYSNGRPSC